MGYADYQIGDVVSVTVTGIQPYGVFASLDEETQGLIHISEVKHGYVEHLRDLFELGEELEVKILDIDEFDGKISLSLRSLKKAKFHPFSNRKKNPRYGRETGTDFDSLNKRMPYWIEVALTRRDAND